MKEYQKEFIKFLIREKVLIFGDFVTKSGRNTPYFVNTGKLSSGESIKFLGEFYASHIQASINEKIDIVFGPAYKGIPLAVTTAIGLCNMGIPVDYCFDRKEVKDHGDGGSFVGKMPKPNQNVVLVEDVVTAGTTLRSIVPVITQHLKANLSGVVIAVDRCEKGMDSDKSAVQESQNLLGIKIYPVITIHQILDYLTSAEAKSIEISIDDATHKRAISYLEKYGAK
jgi:orotate phosphoribosyltransferase